jgi:hypothetical protein
MPTEEGGQCVPAWKVMSEPPPDDVQRWNSKRPPFLTAFNTSYWWLQLRGEQDILA